MTNKISEVQVMPIKARDGLIGFASLVLNDQLFIGSIGIHSKLDNSGYRLTYPTKVVGKIGIHVYHPITRELSSEIERTIFNKFKEVMEKRNDRHSSFESD